MLILICSWQGLSRKIKSFPGSERLLFNLSFRKESTSFIFHPRMLMLQYQNIWRTLPSSYNTSMIPTTSSGAEAGIGSMTTLLCRCDLAGDGEWISNRSCIPIIRCLLANNNYQFRGQLRLKPPIFNSSSLLNNYNYWKENGYSRGLLLDWEGGLAHREVSS